MRTAVPTLIKDARLMANVPKADELLVSLTEFAWDVQGGLPQTYKPAVRVKSFTVPADPADVAEVVSQWGELSITLGPIRCLELPSGRELVYVEVVPADVWQLNWLLCDRYGWDEDAGGYTPRLDVATVPAGRGQRYADRLDFLNASFTVDALTLIGRGGVALPVPIS